MQTENQALWSEIASLRQKHTKQQQIVSKLMEFLLQFITSNSAPNHEQSVEQQPPNEGLTTDLLHPQHAQAHHHTLNQQDPSSNTLKRKHAALTHYDEPNKRTTMQQQQQQQQHFSHPTGLGRQQSVTINELTDNDAGGWLHANTSPLVDLVPSPPPIKTADDNYPQQQQNEYHWPAPTNEPGHNLRHPAFPTVGNGDNVNNPYVPDFILRTDNPSATKIDGANLTSTKTVINDAECSYNIHSDF
jgi:hypothetical protein